jgi:hypothetical protein
MTPEQIAELLAQITAVADGLKQHVDKSCADMGARFDAAMGEIEKKRDASDPDTLAEETAADRRADALQSDLRNLHNRVNAMDIHSKQNAATRDQFADLQSRADVAYRAWSEGAPPPMSGEGILDYAIRLHRPLMKHSKKFAKADLLAMARDPATLSTICDSIRADAVEASMSPAGMPEFQWREITWTMPTGHKQTEFVGSGTFVKQMSRPVKTVTGFGPHAHAEFARWRDRRRRALTHTALLNAGSN